MAYTIKRLVDGATLPVFPQTRLQVNEDAFGSSRTQVTSLGLLGEAVQIASTLDEKLFSLTWISTDTTGQEQHQLRKFFGSSEYYEISAPEWGIDKIWATVDSRELDGWVRTTFFFISRFGEFVDTASVVLSQQNIAAGANSEAYAGSYTNDTEFPVKLQLTIEAASNAVWKAGTQLDLTGLPFVIAAQDEFGRWTITQKRRSVLLDSSRLVLGRGYFRPSATQFFSIRPGETKAISLGVIDNPLLSNVAWSLRFEAISRGVAL